MNPHKSGETSAATG